MDISGAMLRDGLINGAILLAQRQNEINQINVFPVPDGDTGSNMAVTMGTAKRRLLSLPDSCTAAEAAEAAAGAMLRGSRGNSGAILTLFFRGFARGLSGCSLAGPSDLVRAFGLGADSAYRSVIRPAEGTILTVFRETFLAGNRLLKRKPGVKLPELFYCLRAAAASSLKNTPELLSVLDEAEVVDA